MRSRKDLSDDEKLVASTLYQSIFEEGEARGRAQQCANTIIQALIRRTGALDPAVATRIRSVSNLDTLDVWLNQALNLPDADSAHQLIEKISKAPLF
jgi:hypothetical protein